MINYATVELSTEEALLFVQFRKRQAFIQAIESVGGFDIKNGSITINFNDMGAIGSIDVKKHIVLK